MDSLMPEISGTANKVFPQEDLKVMLKQMISADVDMRQVIARYKEYLEYDDVKYYTLKALLALVKDVKPENVSSTFVRNLFAMLSQISLPQKSKSEKQGLDDLPVKNLYIKSEDEASGFRLNYMAAAKIFSSLWLCFLKFQLPPNLHLKVLVKLPDEVMPHIQNPLMLTDFLTESYNIGGSASLLALHGLFILIQKCNLEYPDFYKKLYALFEPSVLFVKYRPRFFFWADIFLTSTHLPAYLVAAFAKRVARLALMAPPHVLLLIIPFIRNLLVRHPTLKVLLHKPGSTQNVENDPYDFEEQDPAKCKALESSLWEIKTLQSHWCYKVSIAARFIDSSLPEVETDLGDVLEGSIDELMKQETRKKLKTAPLSVDKPLGLFKLTDDLTGSFWVL